MLLSLETSESKWSYSILLIATIRFDFDCRRKPRPLTALRDDETEEDFFGELDVTSQLRGEYADYVEYWNKQGEEYMKLQRNGEFWSSTHAREC